MNPQSTLLIGFLVKSTVILIAAMLGCQTLRGSSAATRHLVYSAGLAGTLILPLLSLSLPHWNIRSLQLAEISLLPHPVRVEQIPAKLPHPSNFKPAFKSWGYAQQDPEFPPSFRTDAIGYGAAIARGRSGAISPVVSWNLVIGVWIMGVLSGGLYLAVGLIRVYRLRRCAVQGDGKAVAAMESARWQLGMKRSVEVLRAIDGSVPVPITFGTVRPIVVLPAQSTEWSAETLHAVFLHELSHIQRGDWFVHLMGRLACTIYWYHPLVWLAARMAREESERACDDCVLRAGEKATVYAQSLVDVVRSMPQASMVSTIAIRMAERSEVEGRLLAILAKGQRRVGVTRRRCLAVGAVFCLFVVPLAVLRFVAIAQSRTAIHQVPQRDEEITPEGYRGTWYNGAKLLLRTALHDRVRVAMGRQVKLPNGFTVRIQGINCGVRKGETWSFYTGPWWDADGNPVKIPLTKPWLVGEPLRRFGDSVPTTVMMQVIPPRQDQYMVEDVLWSKHEISYYAETFHLASLQQGRMESPILRREGTYTVTGVTWYFPLDARTATVRVGVGAGPWKTVGTLPLHLSPKDIAKPIGPDNIVHSHVAAGVSLDDKPFLTYQTADGREHVEYFLGTNGQLSNVARRIVAVDFSGHTHVLPMTGGLGTKWVIESDGLFFPGQSPWDVKYNPYGDISRIKELLLETRPYQIVEFRDVSLRPRNRE